MPWGYFKSPCPEFFINTLILKYRNNVSIKRVYGVFACEFGKLWMVLVDCDTCVCEDRFRTSGCNGYEFIAVLYLVVNKIAFSLALLDLISYKVKRFSSFFVLHFDIFDCCPTFWTPGDNICAFI